MISNRFPKLFEPAQIGSLKLKNRLGQDFPLGIIMNGAELGIENGITIITREGNKQTIEADTIIPIAEMAPNDGLYKSLEGKVPEVLPIGDCSSVGLTMEAVASGYSVARKI